jgi:predicted permease
VSTLRLFLTRLFGLFRRHDRRLSEEIEAHLELLADDYRRRGMVPEDAKSAARRTLGNVTHVQEVYRAQWGWPAVESWLQDLRYGLRLVSRNPGFASVAIVVLALAVGANTVIFSVAHALLLKPLAVERPDEIVMVQHRGTLGFSFPDYQDLRDRNDAFEDMAGYRITHVHLEYQGAAHRVWGYLATGNYFDLLGVRPAIGRLFTAGDERGPGESPLAVLSHDTWHARFAGSPDVIGRTITINRLPFTIIGVAPAGFYGIERYYRPEVWVPMAMQPQIEVGNPWLDRRSTRNTWVVGRLHPSVTRERAQANLDAIAKVIATEYANVNADFGVVLTQPGLMGDRVGGPARAFLFGLVGLAGLVLLIGCANVASLLLARGTDRQRELAVRASLGAGAMRLARQVVTETLVLSLLGGITGAALAWMAAELLTGWRAPLDFPVQFDVRLDARVFGFAFAIATAAGLLAAASPARKASRTPPNAILRSPSGSWRRRRWAMRDVLVSGQVALCLVLLVASSHALVGLRRTLSMPLGFNPENAAVIGFELALAGYDRQRGQDFQRRVWEAVSVLPGVEQAAYSNSIPLSPDQSSNVAFPENAASWPEGRSVTHYQVSPGFFRTMGMRLAVGREFEWRDTERAPQVAVVNLAFARRVFGSTDAIGRRFKHALSGPTIEVVGLVEDGKYTTMTEDPRPVVFRPIHQSYNSTTTVIARSSLPTEQVLAAMRGVLATLDPGLPVYGAGGLEQVLALPLLPSRVAAVALSSFGLLALTLALAGLHGLVAYAVASRRREIGIRVALGAASGQIVRLAMQRVTVMVGAGLIAGTALALAVGQLLSAIVYDVSVSDPMVLASAVIAMLGSSTVACAGPLLSALRVDPMLVLRCD